MLGAGGAAAGVILSLESENTHPVTWNPRPSSWSTVKPMEFLLGCFSLRKQVLIIVEEKEKSNKEDTVEGPGALESKDIGLSPSSVFHRMCELGTVLNSPEPLFSHLKMGTARPSSIKHYREHHVRSCQQNT